MVSRSAVRVIACDKLAQWEREARIGAHGLKTTVEVDATQLLTKGVDLPPDATEGDRTIALREAWARVDEGRTRADALRLVSRVLRRILRVLGGEPIYDREAPPETVRQARVGMFAEEVEGGEREPVRLDKGTMVEAAERHGIMQEVKVCGHPGIVGFCGPCTLDEGHACDHCDKTLCRWKVEPNAS